MPPAHLIDWRGRTGRPAAADRPRTRTPASPRRPRSARRSIPTGRTRRACRSAAFIFGGRRSKDHAARLPGLQLGSRRLPRAPPWARRRPPRPPASSAMRRDPLAMLPFCGYHMGDYFKPLAATSAASCANPPRIFRVNWFRKDDDGKFLWPGFGENMRVLKWIVDRVHGRGYAVESPLGWMPRYEDIDWRGLDFDREHVLRPDGGGPRGGQRGGASRTRSCSTASSTGCPRSSSTSASSCARVSGARPSAGSSRMRPDRLRALSDKIGTDCTRHPFGRRDQKSK